MKRIREEKQIEEMLESFSPQISKRLDQRLANAPWMGQTVNQGETTMNTNQARFARAPRSVQRLTFVTLVIVSLLALAFITPQGRALAQSILQFFTRAERTSFPVQVNQPDASEPTALPPAPLISVQEAEAQAGFNVAELPAVPEGFEYLGARMYGSAVSLEYQARGGGGHLILMQSQEGFLQSDWDKVPAEAVVPVKIGELDGEFAQGTFVVPAGQTSAIWHSGAAIMRLRWMQDGIWFELTKFGEVETIEYLDQAGMVELAESLP